MNKIAHYFNYLTSVDSFSAIIHTDRTMMMEKMSTEGIFSIFSAPPCIVCKEFSQKIAFKCSLVYHCTTSYCCPTHVQPIVNK